MKFNFVLENQKNLFEVQCIAHLINIGHYTVIWQHGHDGFSLACNLLSKKSNMSELYTFHCVWNRTV